jgi:hypothetical protein
LAGYSTGAAREGSDARNFDDYHLFNGNIIARLVCRGRILRKPEIAGIA